LDRSNIQWRNPGNYNINPRQQENTNNVEKNKRDNLYGTRHFNYEDASNEIGNKNPKLRTGISTQYKQPKHHINPYTHISNLKSNNQDSVSRVKNTSSRKNLPVLNHSISKPRYKNKLSKSKVTQNVLLDNTFGKGDSKSFRQKRKGPNVPSKEESKSVGYTKITMDGVDIEYSFQDPPKASKRQKKQVAFQRKKKEVTSQPYHDYDSNKKYIGSISVNL
jgi:hypothetical protein